MSRQMGTMDSMIPTKGMEYAPARNSSSSRERGGSRTANPFSNPIQMKPINSIMQQRQQQQQQSYHQYQTQQLQQQQHQQQQHEQQQQQQQQQPSYDEEESAEAVIQNLQMKIRQLTHELTTTQKSHQLTSDQYRAEISSLHSTIEHQARRHEQTVSALRSRLVESEMARNKMQDALSQKMEQELNRQEEEKRRWNEMIGKVNEDKVWVDEQMKFWKESMEEYWRGGIGNNVKVRGQLDAELDEVGVGVNGKKSSGGNGKGIEAGVVSGEDDLDEGELDEKLENNRGHRGGSAAGKGQSQRRRWVRDSDEDSDDSDDSEAKRIFNMDVNKNLMSPSS